MRDNEKTRVMAGHWTRIITRSHPNQGERSQTIYWCQKFAAQREVVWGKNTNILNNYNVTQNLKRTIIYTKLHDMPLSWKLLFGYLHIFFRKSGKWDLPTTEMSCILPQVLQRSWKMDFFVCPQIFCQRGWEFFDGLWWQYFVCLWKWFGFRAK